MRQQSFQSACIDVSISYDLLHRRIAMLCRHSVMIHLQIMSGVRRKISGITETRLGLAASVISTIQYAEVWLRKICMVK